MSPCNCCLTPSRHNSPATPPTVAFPAGSPALTAYAATAVAMLPSRPAQTAPASRSIFPSTVCAGLESSMVVVTAGVAGAECRDCVVAAGVGREAFQLVNSGGYDSRGNGGGRGARREDQAFGSQSQLPCLRGWSKRRNTRT